MTNPMYFLMLFLVVAYFYDKAIDREINHNQSLKLKLLKLKYFNSRLFNKAVYFAMSFKFWGFSRNLNVVGSIFSLLSYFFLVYVVCYIFIRVTA